MSHTITIALTQQTFEAVRTAAEAVHVTPSQWIEQNIVQQFPPASGDVAAARQRLRPYFGCVDSGDPNASSSEGIERDLAEAYADDHNEPKSC